MGDASQTRSGIRNDSFGISGKTCKGRNLPGSPSNSEILGGTISQLILKAENQLAMFENSARETKEQISELKRLLKFVEKNEVEKVQ